MLNSRRTSMTVSVLNFTGIFLLSLALLASCLPDSLDFQGGKTYAVSVSPGDLENPLLWDKPLASEFGTPHQSAASIEGSLFVVFWGGTAGACQVFLGKYDSEGNEVWRKSLATSEKNDITYDVATDPLGNVVVAGGKFGGTMNILKYSKAGVLKWSATLPAQFSSWPVVAVDTVGNAYAS